MVRLKAISIFNSTQVFDVSIPYGTIKSELSPLISRSTDVSIPYGTIKSETIDNYKIINPASFQFLMVRLKAMKEKINSKDYQYSFNSLWYD